MPIRKHRSRITLVKRKLAADTKVVVNWALEYEDQFLTQYDATKVNAAVEPPFNPLMLKGICTRNNILMQCVHAMETNIDGTGYDIADDSQEGKPKGIDPKLQMALEAKSPTPPGPGAPFHEHLFNKMQEVVNPAKAAPAAGTEATAAAADTAGKVLPFGQKKPPFPPDTKPGETPPGDNPDKAAQNAEQIADPNADTPEEEAEKKRLDAFFKEPYPNESFVTTRRKLRADIEMTGNGYLEVIRNLQDEVVFVRHLDAATMRLCKLDEPVLVEKTIERGDDKVSAQMWVRERRFVQRVGTNYLYYKEFGSERKLDRFTGAWMDGLQPSGIPQAGTQTAVGDAFTSTPKPMLTQKALKPPKRGSTFGEADFQASDTAQGKLDGMAPGPAQTNNQATGKNSNNRLASEVLHFICDKDATTAYGVPRWINNLPAVLGSRKAEEFNLAFFDRGGLPPAIIFIQGGALATGVREQLEAFLSGSPKDLQSAAIVEAQSSSGSLDSAGQVKVTVERFGDNRQQDSMFQNYDAKCEDHVRGAFRMPAIFLGRAQDYNFATALTAVMVTEAQVFQPERREFDEKINHTIVRALGAKKYKYKSLPITLKNADLQLKAMALAAPKIDGKDLIDAINQITGLSLSYSASAEKASTAMNMAAAAKNIMTSTQVGNGQGGSDIAGGGSPKPNPFQPRLGAPASGGGGAPRTGALSSVALKADLTSNDIVLLASEWANAMGLSDGPRLEPEMRRAIIQKVESLPKEQRSLFNTVLASATFTRSSFDPEGLADLAGCCAELMDHSHAAL